MKDERDDPIDALRRADPYPTTPLPSDASARLWARIQEEAMDPNSPTHSRRPLGRLALLLSGALVATGALAVALILTAAPAAGGPSVPLGDGTAMCIEVYSPENLVHRELAFDGTVTAVEGGAEDLGSRVTFDVNQVYIGDPGASVTLSAPGMGSAGGDSEGGPAIHVGDRLLISGDDGYAWTCGFSRTWSAEMAAEWEAAVR